MVTLLLEHQDLVKAGIANLIGRTIPPSALRDMCLYHLAAGGKGFRSGLCLSLAEALGADPVECLPAAISLELAHRTSLIFDDIQDNGLERNGQPSVFHVYGAEQAINAGLALSCSARMSLTELTGSSLPPGSALRVLGVLETSVINLCRGQYWDIEYQTTAPPSVSGYIDMVRGKTGALIGAACRIAGILAGVDHHSLESFGTQLGILFQCQDDYLGVWGDAEVAGKVPNDLAEGKRSLPVVLAHEMRPDRRWTDLVSLVMAPEVQARTQDFVQAQAQSTLSSLERMVQEIWLEQPAAQSLRSLVTFTANRMA